MVEMIDLEMEHLPALCSCLSLLGNEAEARVIEERITDATSRRYISPFYFALIGSGRRDREATMAALTRAVDEHATRIVELHADPRFSWLHDDGSFIELVERVEFPPIRRRGSD